ncbi:MAG TPA: glycoside-pentoside-hexuronide (GPH):cation symporter [Clostridia bacterium]|nr:glycoside-pentoside-hexuronide (GPH):cation symporter [Clostridia bacterium]
MTEQSYRKNRWTFGLGTIGRDMLYTLVSMYLLFFMTEVLNLDDATMWWITGVLLAARIFDAVNDPIMGAIVDNTRGKHGKFKPYIAWGAIGTAVITVLMFADFRLTGAAYVVLFAMLYLLWDVAFTANDIGYWSMLPSLSLDQKEREKIGAIARICANIGLFLVVGAIMPVTGLLSDVFQSGKTGWFVFTVACAVIMVGGQAITVFGVKEPHLVVEPEKSASLRELGRAIFKNDQLLFTAVSMSLFMIGYCTTTSFGTYYFKYVYGNENMYSVFGVVLGVAQILALSVFPLFSKKWNRKALYTIGTILVLLGYAVFFFVPNGVVTFYGMMLDPMVFIGIAGMLLFIGQAFIQLLMLMFLADSIEYGQWKLGRRSESVTFALQPFINKIGAAIANAIVGATVIISGINSAKTPADVTPEGIETLKLSMFALPLIVIVLGYIVYLWKFKIDEKMYAQILTDLKERGEINE